MFSCLLITGNTSRTKESLWEQTDRCSPDAAAAAGAIITWNLGAAPLVLPWLGFIHNRNHLVSRAAFSRCRCRRRSAQIQTWSLPCPPTGSSLRLWFSALQSSCCSFYADLLGVEVIVELFRHERRRSREVNQCWPTVMWFKSHKFPKCGQSFTTMSLFHCLFNKNSEKIASV